MWRSLLVAAIIILLFAEQGLAQCISGDCQNGTGIFQYPSGAKYVGQFRNGEIHGIGSCYYSDGSVYKGNWVQRYPNGRGIKTISDGRSWAGQWLRGVPIDIDGSPIDNIFPSLQNSVQLKAEEHVVQYGCLSGNCIDGEGVFGYPEGSRYEGSFSQNKPSGTGSFSYSNGDLFEGSFKDGLRHGPGILYSDKGKLVGEWKEGEYIGIEKGQVGCIAGDCQQGIGTYVYKDEAAKYNGRFENGLPEGDGVIHYKNGDRYEGRWAAGNFNGMGTLYLKDGSEVAGFWEQGVYIGWKNPDAQELTPASALRPEDYIAVRKATDLKVWAVLIGISTYNHMPTLRYTDDDAYRMYAFLKSPEGGALTDEHIRILIDEDATKEKILAAMKEVFSKAGRNDLVLVYYSGHGLRGSFLPIDFDGFNNKLEHEEIKEILKTSQAKYKLLIADACYSGSLLAAKGGESRNLIADYYKTLAEAKAGTAIVLSSKSEEISLESTGLRQGVFSHYLIRGLAGEADTDHNRIVTVQELFDFVDKNVRNYTLNRQTPIISGEYDPNMTISVVR